MRTGPVGRQTSPDLQGHEPRWVKARPTRTQDSLANWTAIPD